MPLYTFHCKKCHAEFEALCTFAESNLQKCPLGHKATRQLSACNLVFSQPKDTSRWDSFSYRAGYNMSAAKDERRAAEMRERDPHPYKDGLGESDFNLPGVFDKGGIDSSTGPILGPPPG